MNKSQPEVADVLAAAAELEMRAAQFTMEADSYSGARLLDEAGYALAEAQRQRAAALTRVARALAASVDESRGP